MGQLPLDVIVLAIHQVAGERGFALLNLGLEFEKRGFAIGPDFGNKFVADKLQSAQFIQKFNKRFPEIECRTEHIGVSFLLQDLFGAIECFQKRVDQFTVLFSTALVLTESIQLHFQGGKIAVDVMVVKELSVQPVGQLFQSEEPGL